MRDGRFAVVIDQPVPRVAYGPLVPELFGTHDHGIMIGHFEDLEAAKSFIETVREQDRRGDWRIGRIRVFDHTTSSFVFESQ